MKVRIIILFLCLIFTMVSADFHQRSARVRTALCTTQTCSKCFKVMLNGNQPINQKRLCTHLFCLPNCCRNKIAYYHTFHWNLDQAPVLPTLNVQYVYINFSIIQIYFCPNIKISELLIYASNKFWKCDCCAYILPTIGYSTRPTFDCSSKF